MLPKTATFMRTSRHREVDPSWPVESEMYRLDPTHITENGDECGYFVVSPVPDLDGALALISVNEDGVPDFNYTITSTDVLFPEEMFSLIGYTVI